MKYYIGKKSWDDSANAKINVKSNIVTIVTSNPYHSPLNQSPAAVNSFPKMKHPPSSFGPIMNLLKMSHVLANQLRRPKDLVC